RPLAEEEAVARTLALARLADAPVYLVHLTTADSLELVRAARRRGQTVWAEACTHHLLLDEGCYARAEPDRFLVVPPLRPRADVEALWDGVADGTLDAIGSDHATAPYRPPFATDDFRSFAYGFGGAGVRVPLVLSEGMRRGMPLERLAHLLATGPARALALGELKRRDDVQVVGVCDLDRARAEALAPPGATVYERFDELLDRGQPDALWVCTPPLAHREPAVAALARGIHVYLEKPIARTGDDAAAIVAAAEASDA